MEVMTETKPTETTPGGTTLSIGSDRSLDEPAGDAVLRVHGERAGQPVIDTAYVEVDEVEGRVLGAMLDQFKTPSDRILDQISDDIREKHGTTSHVARAIAETAARAWWEFFSAEFGPEEAKVKLTTLADRFQRASAGSRG